MNVALIFFVSCLEVFEELDTNKEKVAFIIILFLLFNQMGRKTQKWRKIIFFSVKDSTLHLKEGMKGQLTEASSATSKAYSVYRREMDPEIDLMGSGADGANAEEKSAEEAIMSPAIAIMQPILRFLQLLCENHNRELQVKCFELSFYRGDVRGAAPS